MGRLSKEHLEATSVAASFSRLASSSRLFPGRALARRCMRVLVQLRGVAGRATISGGARG
jgi:hypothetical protein